MHICMCMCIYIYIYMYVYIYIYIYVMVAKPTCHDYLLHNTEPIITHHVSVVMGNLIFVVALLAYLVFAKYAELFIM